MPDRVFKAGAAKADITPKIGTLLYGYVPDSVSTSVHDGLELTAVAFGEGEGKALLISVTVGDIQTELASKLRGIVSDASGVPAGSSHRRGRVPFNRRHRRGNKSAQQRQLSAACH